MRSWKRLAFAAATVLVAAGVATVAVQLPAAVSDRVPRGPGTLVTQPDEWPQTVDLTDSLAPALTASDTRAPDLTWGPTRDQWRRAQVDARALTVEEAAGQVIVPHWNSPDAAGLTALMQRGNFGGVILMGGAVTTADALAELTAAVQQADGGRAWGTLVSTDQEGGVVARLQGIVPDVPGFMAAGAARDKAAVTRAYREAAVDMRALGVTMDFAPVADMTIGLADPTIRTRSAGDKVTNVSATVVAATRGFVDGGVVPVVKHFPGHGSVTVDSHSALPQQKASIAELEKRDLVPFAQAIDAGAPAVMMGHIALAEWDGLPATLAPKAYDYLRGDMGFDGVAVTDALDMGAITRDYSSAEAAVAALAAGADMVLMPADPMAARDGIVAAVESGELSRDRLDEAAARIIALQRWQRSLGPLVDLHTNYGRDLAVAGVTVAAKDCDAPWVRGAVVVEGGSASDRSRLAGALKAHGLTATTDPSAVPASPDSVTTIAFVGGDSVARKVDVAIATGSPWALERSSAPVLVALYGRSADALAGLADVLAGAVAPGGEWPVNMDVPHGTCR